MGTIYLLPHIVRDRKASATISVVEMQAPVIRIDGLKSPTQ